MREELMTEALCWDLQAKITADYAHAAKTSFELSCYCPYDVCLAPVSAKRLTNAFFLAPGRHVAGCPNEARSSEPSMNPGPPMPKPRETPVKRIPNLLGPGPTIKSPRNAPTIDELRQLAAKVRALPAIFPGTLEHVVDAWANLPPGERASHPLKVGGQDLNYDTAFTFLATAAEKIDSLRFDTRIIYGAATVVALDYCYMIETRKRFSSETGKLPLRLISKKRSTVPAYLPDLVNQTATLFCHGVTPQLAEKKNAIRFDVDADTPYAGIALRAGQLSPWGREA